MDRFSIVRDEVTIHFKGPDGWFETAVGDTESGTAAVDSPFVFERFYRAGPTHQRETGVRHNQLNARPSIPYRCLKPVMGHPVKSKTIP